MKKYSKDFGAILSNCRLFKGLTSDEIDTALQKLGASDKTFDKGSVVLASDKRVKEIGILLSGSVSIENGDFWGNRTILSKLGAGRIFGEAYACLGSNASVSVIANEDTTILFFDAAKILTRQEITPRLVENLVAVLASKNVMLTGKIGHISKRTTREKLLSYLSDCSDKAKSASFTIPYNRQELADYLCVDRSAMSSELSKLQSEGLIIFNKNSFQLK